MSARRHDWQTRFAAFAIERAALPFAWGHNDCCLFAADAVLALTGEDFARDWRGSYTSATAAARLLSQRGGLPQIASDALGAAISPLMANLGDVVLVENSGRELLAVCNGTSVICPGEAGLVVLGMDAATAAWRV